MTNSNRQFVDQKRAINEFVANAVDLILERLESQTGHDVRWAAANEAIRESLHDLLQPIEAIKGIDATAIAHQFANEYLESLVDDCRRDLDRYPIQDPAMSNLEEVFYASNGFWATVAYRLANALDRLHVPVVPRAISAIAHSKTGIDIHPRATIAPGLFIDHGTGIAIGCTAVLHANVNLYNGVVLGTSSKPCKQVGEGSADVKKRHPTICTGVSLYTNAFVGGDVTIGENSVIGAYAFVCHNVAPGSTVTGKNNHSRFTPYPKPSSSSDDQAADAADSVSRRAQVQRVVTKRPAILNLIGNTPMVPITNLHDNPKVKIFAKLEGANPSGSVKDRVALSLIERGEASGELTHDKIILESTSGNTGIGLAMVGAAKGYKVVLTMSSAMSEERKKVLRAFGATLIETDPTKGTGGAIEVAKQMVIDEPGKYWAASQHSSLDNPLAHYTETADEILKQTPDVTHFVAGIGTFGTLRGAGVRLRESTGAKVVGVEPVLGQAIQGLRNMNEPNAPQLYDESLLDEKIMMMADDAYRTTRLLAEKEGLLVGMSSGAAMEAALRMADRMTDGVIVVLFPDRGEKYLSTPLFDTPVASTVDHQPVAQAGDLEDETPLVETFVADEYLIQI